MKAFYYKYKCSNKIRFMRMAVVLIAAIALFIIGYNKIFGDANVGNAYRTFSLIVLIIGALLVLLVGFLEIYKELEIEKIFPIVVITFGLVFTFLIPAFETPDEREHFGAAYNQSNYYLDYGDPYEDKTCEISFVPYRYMRQCDDEYERQKLSDNYYDYFLSYMDNDNNTSKIVAVNCFNENSRFFYYLPAVGITLGRILGLNFGWIYVFGVLLNLAFYVLLTTYAINKIPIAKRMIFVISLLPITLQQVSSFSYDSGVFAICFVIIALSFFWKYGDKSTRVKWKWNLEIPIINVTITELIIYILCGVMLYNAKSAAFFIVMFLPFVLAINKKWFTGNNKIYGIIGIVVVIAIICVVLFLLGGLQKITSILFAVPTNVREQYGVNGIAPIEYILNPSKFFGIVGNTLKENASHYIFQIGGGALGYINIFCSKIVVGFNILLLVLSMVRYDKEDDEFKPVNRILSFVVGFVPIALTFLAMLLYWTLPTDTLIMGFQGRYFIPTLMIIMMSIGRWKKIRIPNIDNLFAVGMTISTYAACINVLSFM